MDKYMEGIKINLTNETKASLQEVIASLAEQKSGTVWAQITNEYAIAYAKKLGEVYGDSWRKGLLPRELLTQVLLPHHGHSLGEGKDDILFFPIDTPLTEALPYIENFNTKESLDCLSLIKYLKEEIKKNGFQSNIVLVTICGQLKHVDGLHRMLALWSLLNEGYDYSSVPVYLCDNTK